MIVIRVLSKVLTVFASEGNNIFGCSMFFENKFVASDFEIRFCNVFLGRYVYLILNI